MAVQNQVAHLIFQYAHSWHIALLALYLHWLWWQAVPYRYARTALRLQSEQCSCNTAFQQGKLCPNVLRNFKSFLCAPSLLHYWCLTAFQISVLFKSWMMWYINLENSVFKLECKYNALSSFSVDLPSFHYFNLFSVNSLALWLCHDLLVANPETGGVFTFSESRGQMEAVSFTLKCAKLFCFSFYEKHMKTMQSTIQLNKHFRWVLFCRREFKGVALV